MKMSILNIIISFLLIFQFSLGNLAILSNMPNFSKANELQSIEECGDECRVIRILWFWKKCICPFKREQKTRVSYIIKIPHSMVLVNNKMGFPQYI